MKKHFIYLLFSTIAFVLFIPISEAQIFKKGKNKKKEKYRNEIIFKDETGKEIGKLEVESSIQFLRY